MTAQLVVYKPKSAFKKLTVEELNDFGYELTGRDIKLGKKPIEYSIMEVKNDYNQHPVGFCYLYSSGVGTGIILSNEFDHYLVHPEDIMSCVGQ